MTTKSKFNVCIVRPDDLVAIAMEQMQQTQMPMIILADLVARVEKEFLNPCFPDTPPRRKLTDTALILTDLGWQAHKIRRQSDNARVNRWFPPAEIINKLGLYATRRKSR